MQKIKNKKSAIALVLLLGVGVLTGVNAYFHTADTSIAHFSAESETYSVTANWVYDENNLWVPQDEIESNLNFTNSGDVPMKVRVNYTEKWYRKNATGEFELIPSSDEIYKNQMFTIASSKWTLNTTDNKFYYNETLAPGQTTENFIDKIVFDDSFGGVEDTITTITQDDVHHYIHVVGGLSNTKYEITFDLETIQESQASNWD